MAADFPIPVKTRSESQKVYEGLSRQKLDFHQALAELIDNAISATPPDESFTIEILLEKKGDRVIVTVTDDATGITLEDLSKRILQIGGQGIDTGTMNEHGFGLKNALCVLTGNDRDFKILTRDEEAAEEDVVYEVGGPFRDGMQVEAGAEEEWLQDRSTCISETGTRVRAETTFHYFNTLYKSADLFESLIPRLMEHCGVYYRGYLSDRRNELYIRYRDTSEDDQAEWSEDKLVQPIEISDILKESNKKQVSVPYQGNEYEIEYVYGQLDTDVTEDGGRGEPFPLKIYYKGNQRTQGVDIRVRGKVILPHRLEYIWPDLQRHNRLNRFIGELRIEDPDFRTVNNKTELDPQDTKWELLKRKLNDDFRPEGYREALGEEGIRKELLKRLKGFHPGSKVEEHYKTWEGAGVEIDVLLETENDDQYIYELKNRKASAKDIYQLVMYWDGRVKAGVRPKHGYLVAREFPPSIDRMIEYWNKRDDAEGRNYRLHKKRVGDLLGD